jgi:hypothetical protein
VRRLCRLLMRPWRDPYAAMHACRRGQVPLIGLTPVRGGELPGRLGDGRSGWAVGWRGAGTVPAQVAGEHACHYGGAK